jgi:hypothetical protein
MKILTLVLRTLPLVVSIALSLGAGGLAADAIRSAVARVKKHIAATKTPIDDALFALPLRLALEVAKEIENGKLAGKEATRRVADLVEAILKVLSNLK